MSTTVIPQILDSPCSFEQTPVCIPAVDNSLAGAPSLMPVVVVAVLLLLASVAAVVTTTRTATPNPPSRRRRREQEAARSSGSRGTARLGRGLHPPEGDCEHRLSHSRRPDKHDDHTDSDTSASHAYGRAVPAEPTSAQYGSLSCDGRPEARRRDMQVCVGSCGLCAAGVTAPPKAMGDVSRVVLASVRDFPLASLKLTGVAGALLPC